MSPVEYAGGKRSLRAYIAVCLQIHCNASSVLTASKHIIIALRQIWRHVCTYVYRETSDCPTQRLCGRTFVGGKSRKRRCSSRQLDDTFWSNTFLSWMSLLAWSDAHLRVYVSLLLQVMFTISRVGLLATCWAIFNNRMSKKCIAITSTNISWL